VEARGATWQEFPGRWPAAFQSSIPTAAAPSWLWKRVCPATARLPKPLPSRKRNSSRVGVRHLHGNCSQGLSPSRHRDLAHKQTVEVKHVHIHSGAKGLVGIVNAARGRPELKHDPMRQAEIEGRLANLGKAPTYERRTSPLIGIEVRREVRRLVFTSCFK
jgi:hypothetical protein